LTARKGRSKLCHYYLWTERNTLRYGYSLPHHS